MRFLNILYIDNDMDFKLSIIEKCKSLNNKWQIEYEGCNRMDLNRYHVIFLNYDCFQTLIRELTIDFRKRSSPIFVLFADMNVSKSNDLALFANYIIDKSNSEPYLTFVLKKIDSYFDREDLKIEVFNNSSRKYNLSLEQIIIIKSNKNYLNITTIIGNFVKRGTITSIAKLLPENFIQCNSGSIINTKYIKEFNPEKKILIMIDNSIVFVSRANYKKITDFL